MSRVARRKRMSAAYSFMDMSKAFNDWWNGDELSKDNLHEKDTPAYWAWEGWVAGVKAERAECAKLAPTGIKTVKELFFALFLSIGSVAALIVAMLVTI